MKYVSVGEMIEIERAADASGYTYQDMMEAAGKGLAEIIREEFSGLAAKKVTALVGSGNNGGDALVALDHLLGWGWQAAALLYSQRADQDQLVKRFLRSGGRLADLTDLGGSHAGLKEELLGADLLMDGILGTGIKLPLRDPLKSLLEQTREILAGAETRPRIIAVDCPTGMDCDSGEVDPACIPADITATMGAVKWGLLKFPAFRYLGDLRLVDLGLPGDLEQLNRISREVITPGWVKSRLPARPLDAHKGTFGTVLVVAGSINYPGAALLAGRAAYRAGAGLVSMAVPDSIYPGVIGALPEATWLRLEDEDGGMSPNALGLIKENLQKPTALLVGPGLGTSKGTKKLLKGILQLKNLPPLVLDADGLRLAGGLSDWPDLLPGRSILTPHPGELAGITGLAVGQIQEDRIRIAEQCARQWNQIVLLKGAHSVIADPGGSTIIIPVADPALARAGSGDVLAGIVASLVAQGLPSFQAAACGAWLHARTGALAAGLVGSRAAVLAGDLVEALGRAFP